MSHLSVLQAHDVLTCRPRFVGVSDASNRMVVRYGESMRHFSAPTTRQRVALPERFRALVEQWRDETQFISSVTRRIAHPAYLRIVAMGEPALPLILRDLQETADLWAPALAAITGVDPTRQEDWGDMRAIARAWLQWAERQGVR